MAPNYDHLTLMQKVEVFEHALSNTNGDDLAKLLWLKSPSSEVTRRVPGAFMALFVSVWLVVLFIRLFACYFTPVLVWLFLCSYLCLIGCTFGVFVRLFACSFVHVRSVDSLPCVSLFTRRVLLWPFLPLLHLCLTYYLFGVYFFFPLFVRIGLVGWLVGVGTLVVCLFGYSLQLCFGDWLFTGELVFGSLLFSRLRLFVFSFVSFFEFVLSFVCFVVSFVRLFVFLFFFVCFVGLFCRLFVSLFVRFFLWFFSNCLFVCALRSGLTVAPTTLAR